MPRTHRRLLDAFGGLEADAAKVEALWEARRAAQDAADAHRAEVERAQRESDWLRHAVDELGKLAPQAGEETALAERRTTDDAGREGGRGFARRARGDRRRQFQRAGACRRHPPAGAAQRAGAGS